MEKYKYKFSVIIPVYNVEEYLEETVESVINQTIDFKNNIEIIFVNDGSKDNSEEICLKYVKLYPDNISYIKQDNAGVSAARNNGLDHAKGEYINFLDSDDYWDTDVFVKALRMFEKNPSIDIIGVRQKYFEAQTAYPSLDFKFDNDKVVDIFNNYNHIQLSVTSGFIRHSAIKNIRFDTKVKFSEDGKFLTEIIFESGKLGIIGSSIHHYRKRLSANSAIQTKNNKTDWYIETLDRVYKYLVDLSIKKYGYVIPYVQYYIAYDYQWRFKEAIGPDIPAKVIEDYKKKSRELLSYVDDKIIAEQQNIYSEYKLEALKFKYQRDISEELKYWNHKLYFNNLQLLKLDGGSVLKLNVLKVFKEKIILAGTFNLVLPKSDYDINLIINNDKKYPINLIETRIHERRFFNEKFASNKGFKIELDLKDIKSIHFELIYKNLYPTVINFDLTNCNNLTKDNYFIKDNKIIYYKSRRIRIENATLNIKLFKQTHKKKSVFNSKYIKTSIIRNVYFLKKKFKKKEIWLISDRGHTANDNGYAFFKYLNSIDSNIQNYFIISKKSKDFDKVKKTGKYLIFNSLKYKIYFLLADKIISSQADDWVMNPFGLNINKYKDIINADFVFLQHGITKDDLSTWLNQYEKDIRLFITAASDEYKSLLDEKYNYGEEIVKLTGFPRYDLLEDNKEKIIAVMPTWRYKLSTAIDNTTGERNYNSSFSKSEYFKFYNNLINDKRLIEIMKKYSYKGLFICHPSHQKNIEDFTSNEYFDIPKNSVEYSEIFSKSSLLVTDYSSVAFDFAYLHKPVIYTQGDSEEFYANQIYSKGYFDTENDGFGPVLYDYESTVEEIIKYIKNDCKLEPKYENRIKKFYKYNDRNNSQRVYEEILKMKK